MCEFVEPVRVLLPPEPSSAGRARRVVDEHVCPLQDGDTRDRAVLLVSELVTNALTHGGPPIELEVRCDDEHFLQVRVRDAGSGRPSLVVADPDEERGRGIALTALLSDSWGVEPARNGKTVWFRLRHLQESPAADGRSPS